jgi:hypothetical protein
LLTIKECLFIKDDVSSRDNNTFIWNPNPVNINRVIANKVADIGL